MQSSTIGGSIKKIISALSICLSWLLEQGLCIGFYWGVFGFVLGYLGLWAGVWTLLFVQLFFWLIWIRIYDLGEYDFLGLDFVKSSFPRLARASSCHWFLRVVRFLLLEFNFTPAGVFLCLRPQGVEGLGGAKGFAFFCFIVVFKTTYWTLAHANLLPFYKMAQ